jgi:hypothetical protein
MIRADLNRFSEIQIEPSRGSPFYAVFGGRTPDDIPASIDSYLQERIHYIGTTHSDLNEKSTYALNYGPDWMYYYYANVIQGNSRARPTGIHFRGDILYITSPRTGFVSIGGAYTAPAMSNNGDAGIDRMDTLVHEARHSDCPSVPANVDLESYNRGEPNRMSLEGQACTHVHVKCPEGHPLVGELACDGHAWGAYTMGYVYSRSVYKDCPSCNEKQRQEGLAAASDDFSRLLKPIQDQMNDGTAPLPDMSSIR